MKVGRYLAADRPRPYLQINPLERRGNYSATSNNMMSVHWPLMVRCYMWYSEEGTGVVPAHPVPSTQLNSIYL